MKHKKGDKLNIDDELGWKYYYGHVTSLRECDYFDELEEDFQHPEFNHGYGRYVPGFDDEHDVRLMTTTKKKGHGIFPFTIIQEQLYEADGDYLYSGGSNSPTFEGEDPNYFEF